MSSALMRLRGQEVAHVQCKKHGFSPAACRVPVAAELLCLDSTMPHANAVVRAHRPPGQCYAIPLIPDPYAALLFGAVTGLTVMEPGAWC